MLWNYFLLMFFLEVLDASHEFNHIPKASCEWFLFMLKHICAKSGCQKWHQYPESPTRTQLLCPNLPLTLWWIGHLERVSPGRVLINERATRLRYSDETRGGGERRETNGSDGEEEETEGGEWTSKTTTARKQTTGGKKQVREKREAQKKLRSTQGPRTN